MSDYQPTEADARMAMLNRGFTEAQVSALLRDLKAEAWDEGRASVGEQMLQPRDEFGMWPEVPNPYRGGSDG